MAAFAHVLNAAAEALGLYVLLLVLAAVVAGAGLIAAFALLLAALAD